jgi:TetR/AcrR family transcriptional regulator, lmrAB and yxaGH operons repressor
MARRALVEDDVLIDRLSEAFRSVGYEAASLAMLAQVTGLKKASLYHRFPGGKEQMGQEVLQNARAWFVAHVLEPLTGDSPPAERITAMARELDCFYRGGAQPCLLNLMSSPVGGNGPFKTAISQMFEAFVGTLEGVVAETGCPKRVARDRAERAVALIQGSLVMARGMGSTEPFRNVLKTLPSELLSERVH